MKKDFTQSLEHRTCIYFLVEAEDNKFLQFTYDDEEGVICTTTLELEGVDEAKDLTLEIAKFLYDNGLALVHYRELVREVSLSHSFIDDTPGVATTIICIYVRAERTDRPVKGEGRITEWHSLDETLDNFESSLSCPHVVLNGVAMLYNERGI